MSAFEMQVAGYAFIGGGIVFFIVSQVLLGWWIRSYEAESRRM